MLRETVRQAIEKGIIKSNTIIVDATHSAANAKMVMPTQVLRELSRQLRREIYRNLPDLSEGFPEKPEVTAELDEEIDYTRRLLEVTAQGIESGNIQGIMDLHFVSVKQRAHLQNNRSMCYNNTNRIRNEMKK